jgi:phospholipid transport system substrate-binding protein
MFRRTLIRVAPALTLGAALAFPSLSWADEAPNTFIETVTNQVLDAIRSDPQIKAGQFNAVMAAVDRIVLPNVNFKRMTASATGPGWRKATPQQQEQLQNEFKTLLVRTYAGALKSVSNETVDVLPMRNATGNEVMVRSLVRGKGDPIQLDYRLEKTPGKGHGWQVYDVNIMGVWMVESYRNQFAQAINAGGVDGLIKQLQDRNRANASSSAAR